MVAEAIPHLREKPRVSRRVLSEAGCDVAGQRGFFFVAQLNEDRVARILAAFIRCNA
jgi:hypothetical protein